MKRIIMLSFICLGLSFTINADEVSSEKSFVRHCSNFSSDSRAVSYSYSSCVVSNFASLSRQFDPSIFLSHCSNFGTGVSYSFTSCINRNFNTLARSLDRTVFVSYCGNYRNDELSYSFVSCTNNNFRTIQNELNRL